METTSNDSLPLDSMFMELRGLPRQPPRREVIAGLKWKALFRGPVLMLWPVLLLFCFFPIVIFATIMEGKTPRQQVSARVIQVEHLKGEQTFVKYRYVANGRNYTGASIGSGNSLLSILQPGATLQISFEKGQPQNSAPAFETAAQERFPLPLLFLFPMMAVFFFTPLFFPQMRVVFLARKLFARGVLTNGSIRFIKTVPMQTPMMPGGSSQLLYDFRDENGTLHRGAMKCDNAWLVQQFEVESPVIIAFNPEKPSQNVVLEPFVA